MTGSFATSTWEALAAADGAPPERFDPASLDGLPATAQRWLRTAVPAGAPLTSSTHLTMSGTIRLGRWFPFRASQILRAGVGFVWRATVGGRIVRFVGADALGPDGGRLEFRLHGRIPVVRASGPDVERSAAGRLAAETVAWLPQAATPQAGARWSEGADGGAVVTLDGPGGPTDVEIAVDDRGALRELRLRRWRDSASPPAFAPFGGDVTGQLTAARVRIAGEGSVGWDWGTDRQAAGVFFRYRISDAGSVGAPPVS